MEVVEIIKMVVMWLIGFGLIYLAVKKEYESPEYWAAFIMLD